MPLEAKNAIRYQVRTMPEPTMARMDRLQLEQHREVFIALLDDAVESGASVGFLPPLDARLADDYWRSVGVAIDHGDRRLFGLWAEGVLAGTIQLERAAMPNGRHRAEVMKLMVHRSFRGRGFGRLLMAAVEEEARGMGLRLLELNTRQGGLADIMYRKLGWQVSGFIPAYAQGADGELHPTVIFYKELR